MSRVAVTREFAVGFAVSILRRADDWQDAQHAMADHPRIGPWLEASGDPIAAAQSIIREAEQRLDDGKSWANE